MPSGAVRAGGGQKHGGLVANNALAQPLHGPHARSHADGQQGQRRGALQVHPQAKDQRRHRKNAAAGAGQTPHRAYQQAQQPAHQHVILSQEGECLGEQRRIVHQHGLTGRGPLSVQALLLAPRHPRTNAPIL